MSDKPSVSAEDMGDRVRAQELLDVGVDEEADNLPVKMCFCNDLEIADDLVYCEGINCEVEWFHVGCVGLEDLPDGENWFCSKCNEDVSEFLFHNIFSLHNVYHDKPFSCLKLII